MRAWLFRLLSPKHDAAQPLAELRREYERKWSTLQRSPLDESVWARKFAVLDADYANLVKDTQDVRDENVMLKRTLAKLLS
jgi:erythromycin esterase-like protein